MRKYNHFIIAVLAIFTACTGKSPEATHNDGMPAEDEHSHGAEVIVSAAQLQMVGIEVAGIEQKNLSTALAVNGTLAVPNQNKAFVTILGSGTVRTLLIHPGDLVRKGQLLATVANAQVADLQQQLVTAQSELSFASKEVARLRELVKGNAAPLKSLQKAESEQRSLTARLAALKQQLQALGAAADGNISSMIRVTAPISGSISDVHAEIGSQVDAGTPIAQITNNAELHLDLFVYEKDLSKVAVGQTIHFTLTNNPGKEYDARIFAIGTAFASQSRAVPVHAHVIHDKSGLIEGMSVTARISLGSEAYPAVPDASIISHDGKDYVFVLNTAESNEKQQVFERVQVFRGASDVGYTEIKSITPFPAGTQVAAKGAFFLMAMLTNEGDHDH